MHAILNTEKLRTALKQVIGSIEKRANVPVLACVQLKIEKNNLSITATDMDMETTISLGTDETFSSGAACVDAHILIAITAKAQSETLTIKRHTDQRLHISAKDSHFKLNSLSADDFPSLKDDVGTGFDMAADTLRHLIGNVNFAVSTEETRYYLNGVFFQCHTAGVRAVATDGHRLALCERSKENLSFPAALLPRKTVGELLKLMDSAQIVNVAISTSKVRFRIGDVTLLSKLIDGTFPDYERVIPSGNTHILTLNAKSLIAAIERIKCVAPQKTNAITFDMKDANELTLSAHSEYGEANESVEATYKGLPQKIKFNAAYVLSVLDKIPATVRIELADGKAPAVFSNADASGLKFVVMPMVI